MGRGRGRGRRRAGALAAVAAAAVLAAGCSASGDGASKDMSAVAPAQAAAGEAAKADAAVGAPGVASAAPKAPPGQPGVTPVVDSRQIAYSAQLTVRTAQVDTALAKARDLAVAAGGYVASETGSSGGDGGPQSGQITVKVPSAAFQPTLDQLAGLGEVLSRRSQAEDLTQQVADVNSRMQSQQVSVDRVRALMAQAKTLAEIVSLESELSRREADLESLQKQVKELSARTSLSTVTLDVRQKAGPVQDVPDAPKDKGFWASVGSALGGGWHLLGAIVRGVAVTVAAVLPFLLVAAPVAAVVWVLRRRRKPTPAPVPAPAPAPAEQEDEAQAAQEEEPAH
ncbi:DUF4349 domain-containing protein [Kitasatospora purpeofusca]|uniref:DUF4349 domain-containing protein n=1 Tax=Kitasatospora purpeofusca TaxID=67352 RepID=UPI00367DBF95